MDWGGREGGREWGSGCEDAGSRLAVSLPLQGLRMVGKGGRFVKVRDSVGI